MKTRLTVFALFILGLLGCAEPTIEDYSLKGTWVDQESFALQFLDFYSKDHGRLVHLNKEQEQQQEFTYELVEEKLILDFENGSGKTTHNMVFLSDDRMEIGDLTTIPENPVKVYIRSTITTRKTSDEVVIGVNDIYYDQEGGFRLQVDSVLNDSRCPEGVQCFWEGNVEVKLNLIINGNEQHIFNLDMHSVTNLIKQDTLIQGITYKLLAVSPLPNADSHPEQTDYKVTVGISR